MSGYEIVSTILEAYIALILTAEYFFGRSDTDIKREESRKRKKKIEFESLTNGEMK